MKAFGWQKQWLSLGCWQLEGRNLTSSNTDEHKVHCSLVEVVVCKVTSLNQRVLHLLLPSLLKVEFLHMACQYLRLSLAASKTSIS